MTMNDYDIHTLPNGIRVIHKQVTNTKISHCGFILDIGSRDEQPHQLGMAHFWEHLAFKGTEKRKAYHILTRLDAVGGDLNAYTTKEKICFHASVLQEHFEKALDLLTDITFHSIFPEKEIQKEKGVILEEMSMYLDDPADAIADHFDEIIYPNHPLGMNILGTNVSVSGFNRQNFLEFVQEHQNNERIIFSSVSALPLAKVIHLAEKYLMDLPKKSAQYNRQKFEGFKKQELTLYKPITQAHCIIGTESYPLSDDKRLPFGVLVNLLGGSGMNSRLNMTLREKYGLVYGIEANYHTFTDSGIFSIYFATDKSNLEKCNMLVMKELSKLKNEPLGTLQLHRAKQQIMGQLAMSEESNLSLMLMLGKSMLDLGKIDALNTIFEEIEALSASQLMDIANEMFAEDRLSKLVYLPEN
ncbi:Predicted Zn-dependent peptidase [Thermoflexibacter ruber]|uniref:Predicted Zn-dependent peptidase n=2 Tax=Thermoflexibacter ruber TaxID=1003 RepID=A0A1I2I5S6_9BACT|nr:Predicted Zn-dependent peptidase [Thermoflexibacter ruber]